jgi:hypothetical protein
MQEILAASNDSAIRFRACAEAQPPGSVSVPTHSDQLFRLIPISGSD